MGKRLRSGFGMMAALCLLAAPMLAAAAETANVAGAWQVTWQGQQGERTMDANFAQDGESLTGSLVGPQGREMPLTGSVKGNAITFTVTFQTQRGEFQITYQGTVEGDTMKGTAQTPQATIEWNGKRK